MRLVDIDWASWTPRDIAAVTYLVRDTPRGREVLLIHKKRGLGAGKVNAPGGRLEAGETLADAAVREVEEEVGLRITAGLREVGVHRHQFVDGLGLEVHAFLADAADGVLVETDEAAPFWVPIDGVPYAQMWADNPLWLPQIFAGAGAVGRYVFDRDTMLDFEVRILRLPGE